MKILYISNFYPPYERGGAEIYLKNLVDSQIVNGNSVRVITSCVGKKFFDKNIINLSYKSNDIINSLLLPSPYIYRKIYETILFLNPDIVHIFNFHYSLSSAPIFASLKLNKPTIFTMNDYYLLCPTLHLMKFYKNKCFEVRHCIECISTYYKKHIQEKGNSLIKNFSFLLKSKIFLKLLLIIRKIMLKKILNSNLYFISPNNFIKEILIKKFNLEKNRVEVIPYFSNFKKRKLKIPLKNEIGFVGTLSNEKGILNLINVVKEIPNCKLHIAGDGCLYNKINRFIHKNNLSERIFLYGKISNENMNEFYKKIKFLVIPSIWPEVFGIVGIEAMANYRPIIGANIGGITDWLIDNYNGLLFNPKDLDDMRKKIEYLLNNNDKNLEYSNNAFQYVEQYLDSKNHLEKINNFYNRIINENNIN